MTPEEFRKVGYQIIDWIAEYRSTVGEYPVMSQLDVGDLQSRLPQSPPKEPEQFDAILDDLNDILLPGITHWVHPDFFGYFPANALLPSVLGDMVSSALSVIGLNWQSSPALTELETLMCNWLRQMVGLSESWQGVIQATASNATLVALLCARERITQHGQMRGGLQANDVALTIYTSTQCHSSVKKGALLAGFGLDNVRAIETDEQFALRVDLLEEAIQADIAIGKKPCAIVATVGTTATTAIDPVADIVQMADRYHMWLHVDAAMAGAAMILPECRWMWEGIEGADSLVINAHKWLGVGFDCSLYYVRDPQHLIQVMSTNPSYLQTSADGEAINYRDWGIPLGRRLRALKLWFVIREQGVSGLQARLRRDMANAQWLYEQIAAEDEWEIVAPVPLQTICVRHCPKGMTADEIEVHTISWVEKINKSGEAYLTPSQINGRWLVRISIGSYTTEIEHVNELWDTLQKSVG